MKDELDLEFREHALEHAAIEDRPGDLAIDLRRDRRVEARHVERHDRPLGLTRRGAR